MMPTRYVFAMRCLLSPRRAGSAGHRLHRTKPLHRTTPADSNPPPGSRTPPQRRAVPSKSHESLRHGTGRVNQFSRGSPRPGDPGRTPRAGPAALPRSSRDAGWQGTANTRRDAREALSIRLRHAPAVAAVCRQSVRYCLEKQKRLAVTNANPRRPAGWPSGNSIAGSRFSLTTSSRQSISPRGRTPRRNVPDTRCDTTA